MGCCGSKDAEAAGRLEVVAGKINAAPAPTAGSRDGLEELEWAAKELSGIMDKIVEAGAKDTEGIVKVETLSDVILGNLTGRVTVKVLQEQGADTFQALEDEILRIARVLDAVRATKASSILEQHIKTERGKIETHKEKQADVPLKNIKAGMDKVLSKDPAQLLPGAKAVLDWSEKANEIAPDNKKVTDQLLKSIVQLSIHILKVEKMWAGHPPSCGLIKQLANRLDGIAEQLVGVMGAAWDPPMSPQVESVIKTYADKMAVDLLLVANKQLAANNAGGSYDALEKLAGWWPYVKEAGAYNLEIVGVFSKIQSYANKEIQKATATADEGAINGIKEFAGKFDALRTQFDGLPPPAERGTLGDTLKVGEAKGLVLKTLKTLEEEVAKTTDDDKTTHLSESNIIQALEVLAETWPTVEEEFTPAEDGGMLKQVEKSCKAVEDFAVAQAASVPASRFKNLLKFAEQYDSRRCQIPPSVPLLRPRIALHATRAFMKVAEAEVAKTEGMNSNRLLDSLKDAAEAIPLDDQGLPEGALPEVRERLSKVVGAVDTRMLKSFTETLCSSKGSNVRKENALMKFAAQVDELRAEHIKEGPVSQGLRERMTAKRRSIVEDYLSKIEEHLAKSGPTNFEVVVQALYGVEQAWSDSLGDTGAVDELFAEDTLQGRVSKVIAGLEPCLSKACEKAGESGDSKRIDDLVELATQLEQNANSLRAKLGDSEEGVSLRSGVLTLALDEHIKLAGKACKDGKPDVLQKELDAMAYLCDDKAGTTPCPDAPCASVLEFISGLRDPLLEMMLTGGADKVKAVQKAAAAADEAAKVARRGEDAGDKESLATVVKGVQGVFSKLEVARAESAKPSNYQAKVVIEVLKDLKPIWASAASHEVCKKTLMEVLVKMNAKFKEAGTKALAGDEKRRDTQLQGLLQLAADADNAQEALLSESEGLSVEKNHAIVARILADNALTGMEAELEKEKGMNPGNLVKGVKALTPIWTRLGGASAMDAAFDEVSGLRSRWSAVRAKISTRMMESMEDAVSSSNDKKKQALLKFAGEFDSESTTLAEEGSAGLEAELRGKMEG